MPDLVALFITSSSSGQGHPTEPYYRLHRVEPSLISWVWRRPKRLLLRKLIK